MKNASGYYGYRYGSYKTDGGYTMHSIQVYYLEPLLHNGPSARVYSTDLFTVEMQSGHGYDRSVSEDPTYRPLLVNAYGLRVTALKISHQYAHKALRPFVDVADYRGCARGVVKALRKLRAVKIVYNSKESSFLPARFRRMQEVYFTAAASGLKIA